MYLSAGISPNFRWKKNNNLYIMIMRMIRTGFRFNPTDDELVQFFLRKISGHEMQLYGHVIVEGDAYELDRQHLQCLLSLVLSSLSSPLHKILLCFIYFWSMQFYWCLNWRHFRVLHFFIMHVLSLHHSSFFSHIIICFTSFFFLAW